MFWLIAQIWIFLALAFAGGLAAGWWMGRAPTGVADLTSAGAGAAGQTSGRIASASPRQAAADDTTIAAPERRDADSPPDDLTQIIGLDDNIANRLNALGIFHLDQIANWSPQEVKWVEQQISDDGRISRERWIEQASSLAGEV